MVLIGTVPEESTATMNGAVVMIHVFKFSCFVWFACCIHFAIYILKS